MLLYKWLLICDTLSLIEIVTIIVINKMKILQIIRRWKINTKGHKILNMEKRF